MKTPDEIQAEYEIRLALRQAEARGVIDCDLRTKIERKWLKSPQVEPEWLSDGKRADQWTFSAAILAGAAILALAFLAFWAL